MQYHFFLHEVFNNDEKKDSIHYKCHKSALHFCSEYTAISVRPFYALPHNYTDFDIIQS